MHLLLPRRQSISKLSALNAVSAVLAPFCVSLLLSILAFDASAQCADISYTGDCDGDGVVNGLDLDDDNDGIYDIDEVDCATPAMNSGGYAYNVKLNSSPTASGTLTNLSSYTGITAPSSTFFDYYFEVQGTAAWGSGIRFFNDPALGGDYLNFQVNKSDLLAGDIGYVELNFNEYITHLEFDLGGIDNQDAMTFLAYYNGVQVPNSSINIQNVNIPPANYHQTGNKIRSSSGGDNAPNNTARINVTGPVDQLVLRFAKENYNNVSTWQIYNFRYCIELNHDADGNPNRFDLDSDDDICPDVIEANFSDQNLDGILGDDPTIIDNTNGMVIGTDALIGYAGSSPAVTDGVAANSIDCGILLPVEMIGFYSECLDGKQVVKWSTASESNNDYFLLQSSNDGLKWESHYEINGVGNSTSITDYLIEDVRVPADAEFIRLKQVDFDGNFEYSYLIATKDCNEEKVNVYSTGEYLDITNSNTLPVTVSVYSMSGQLISSTSVGQHEKIELDSGIYMYAYESEDKVLVTDRFMIVK